MRQSEDESSTPAQTKADDCDPMSSIYARFSPDDMLNKDLRAVIEQSRREWEAHVQQKMEEYWQICISKD